MERDFKEGVWRVAGSAGLSVSFGMGSIVLYLEYPAIVLWKSCSVQSRASSGV